MNSPVQTRLERLIEDMEGAKRDIALTRRLATLAAVIGFCCLLVVLTGCGGGDPDVPLPHVSCVAGRCA